MSDDNEKPEKSEKSEESEESEESQIGEDDKTELIPLITEDIFREAYQFEEVRKPSPGKVIAKFLKCSKKTVFNFIPILQWIPKYKVKTDLLGDVIAGGTVAALHITHGLAYAPLGGVIPVVGFYMAVFPVFIYMIFGTSRHISIGTFAVVCAMAGEVVTKYSTPQFNSTVTQANGTQANGTQFNSTNNETVRGNLEERIDIAIAVCLMVGIWQAGLGLLKLGCLTVIMSESLVSGFTTGAAVHVFSYQLKNLFGIKMPLYTGRFKLIHLYINFFSRITTVNLITMTISLCCIFILLLFNEYLKVLIKKRFPKNKFPIPIELIVIVLGILFSYFLELNKNYDVSVIGFIPKGFPTPSIPKPRVTVMVILDSLIIAIVALAINLSLARIFAKKSYYTLSSNQEFFAYGLANIVSSFFSCLPSAASLSRSSIQHTVGGKTQLAGLFSSFVIILILYFAGPLFQPEPYCVLSSIVVVTLKGLLFQFGDLPKIWRESWTDGVVWVVTFLSVIFLDLDIGLGIGILASIVFLLHSLYVIETRILGQVPNTNIFLDINYYKSTKPVPNILVLQLKGNLNYSNTTRFEYAVMEQFTDYFAGNAQSNTRRSCILDMSALVRIDPTAVNSLRQLKDYLNASNCDLYITNCTIEVYRMFEVCNIFKDIPREKILASVSDAVEYLTKQAKLRP